MLNAKHLGITDITGLEYATHLKSLSVGGNQISDLTPLSNLKRLTRLNIDDNVISDISPLSNLLNLTRLEARRNDISDISILTGLLSLRYVGLSGNPITDTSALEGLRQFSDVDIRTSGPPLVEPQQPVGPPQDNTGNGIGDSSSGGQDQQQQQSEENQDPQTLVDPINNNGESNGGNQQQQQEESKTENNNSEGNGDQEQQQQQQQEGQEPSTPQPDSKTDTTSDDNSEKEVDEEDEEGTDADDGEDESEDTKIEKGKAECEALRGTWIPYGDGGVCVRPLTPEEWEEIDKQREGNAPFHPKNAFILDRETLEQMDPATLEAQLDLWHNESDGSSKYLRSIALLESILATLRPDQTQLLPNYPNPFNPETWIPYHLANPSRVVITIYDVRGTVVRQLDIGHQREGYYTSRSRAAYWDGTNDFGERVASGVYFYQLETDKVSILRKMLILK